MDRYNFSFLRFLEEGSEVRPPPPPWPPSVLESPTLQFRRNKILGLPDRIIHDILWFLGIDEIARFGCLSKTCKMLSKSVSRLSIDSQKIGDDPIQRKRFHEFLMSHFCGMLDLKSFEVSWVFQEGNSRDELKYIVRWLQEAVTRCLQYIRLDFQPREEFQLLTQRVHDSISIDSLYRSTFTRFDWVQVLSLNSVAVDESSVNLGWWIAGFVRLRRLKLVNIRGITSLSITSVSLEELFLDNFGDGSLRKINVLETGKLKKLVACLDSYDDDDSFLTVSASQLSTLSINGDIAVELGDLRKLESAFLYWKEDPYQTTHNKKLLDAKVAAVLGSARKARFLVSHELFLESLLQREGLAIPSFDYAEDFLVYVTSSDYHPLSAIANFLTHLPNKLLLVPELECHSTTGSD